MIGIPPGVRILIAMQPVDFRRGADSLATLAKEVLEQDPFSGTVLVFRAKRADRVKVVAWDGSGLVMLWKRLDEGAWRTPLLLTTLGSWSSWLGSAVGLIRPQLAILEVGAEGGEFVDQPVVDRDREDRAAGTSGADHSPVSAKPSVIERMALG